ncbi:MAG: antitoxin [Candidatus Altiarchaeota archaeon]
MVFARVELEEYTNKVLNVVKARFGLHDKSEALNKFVEMYGDEVVEHEATDEYLKKVLEIDESHAKKYGRKKMSVEELDELCNLD